MLGASSNPWSSEWTRLLPTTSSPESPPESASSSPSRAPKLVLTTAVPDITPPPTISSSPVRPPTDLPGYLRIPIPSPSRGRLKNTKYSQTPHDTTKQSCSVHTSVSDENKLSQRNEINNSYPLPNVFAIHGQSNDYRPDVFDGDQDEDDIPPGYPYETFAGVLRFAREYLCGMQDLAMTWLEERRGIRAST